MRTIATIQQKGGAGKTTANYLIASGAISNGLKVHCIDGDRNSQLGEWERRSQDYDWKGKKPIWPTKLSTSQMPSDIDLLYNHLNDLEKQRVDLVLLDTRPGSNADTEDIAYASDVILIPTRAEAADYELAVETYNWIKAAGDTFENLTTRPALALLLSDASKTVMDTLQPDIEEDRLTQSERYILGKLLDLPFINTAIPASRVCSQLPLMGPLSAAIDVLEKNPGTKLQAKPVRKILEIAQQLASEVMNLGGNTK